MTKVLEGLRTFNKRLKEQSGIDNPWDRWFDHFGKYKGLVQSILLSIAVFAALLTMCGCCCIPCIRALFQRLIDRAITPMNAMLAEQVHFHVVFIFSTEPSWPTDLPEFQWVRSLLLLLFFLVLLFFFLCVGTHRCCSIVRLSSLQDAALWTERTGLPLDEAQVSSGGMTDRWERVCVCSSNYWS